MSTVKKMCVCAFLTAMCYVLPQAFHILPLGIALSQRWHIPFLFLLRFRRFFPCLP